MMMMRAQIPRVCSSSEPPPPTTPPAAWAVPPPAALTWVAALELVALNFSMYEILGLLWAGLAASSVPPVKYNVGREPGLSRGSL